jgi:hypothetical protein
MLNKDFLKEIFTEEKKLLRLDEVKRICVPLYDELAVIKLWPMMKSDQELMKFFPTKMAKGRVPDREYFFNVLNTFQGEYLQRLIRHASDQRNESQSMAKAKETIEITDDWWNILNSVPFVSCKSKML